MRSTSRSVPRGSFTEEERAWLQSMVSQCGQALERASQYEAEQTIAETLQRSVLPSSLPRVEGVELAARYLPGSAAARCRRRLVRRAPAPGREARPRRRRRGRQGRPGSGEHGAAAKRDPRLLRRPPEALVRARRGSTGSPTRCSTPPSRRSPTWPSSPTRACAACRPPDTRRRSSPTPTDGSS